MVTVNKFLESLTKQQVEEISDKYLRGWVNLQSEYKIMLRGLNHKRDKYGLPRISRDDVFDYRDQYVKDHYSMDQRIKMIDDYLSNHLMDKQRAKGILLFNCRFDTRYVKAFRSLIGKEQFDKLSEKRRVNKMMSTQKIQYGGVGLASEQSKAHAHQTTLDRYGKDNPMQVKEFSNKLFISLLNKVGNAMVEYRKTHDISVVSKATFNGSRTEMFVLEKLCQKFGYDNVYYQYGVYPKDSRYPFNCDFYIKSKDLFIELNYYYVHGNHWFDNSSKRDLERLARLTSKANPNISNDSYSIAIDVWTNSDIKKRNLARKNKLNYLVFWKYPKGIVNNLSISDLVDFNDWLINYDGSYSLFIKDHPENTY